MSTRVKKALLKYILPILVVLMLYPYNYKLGLIGSVLFLVYILFKTRISLYSFIGGIKYTQGNMSQSIKWFERAYKTGKASPRTITSYAYIVLKSGKIKESEGILNKLISTGLNKDDEMYAKSNLALVLWKKGELESAVAMMDEIFTDYKNSTMYGSLGYLLIAKGDLERALQFNLEAYEYNDSNTIIIDNLGQTYYLTGRYEEALDIYEKLTAKNPTFPEAYYNYGLVLVKLGQPEKALEMVQKALNYKLSFLSTICRADIEEKINEINNSLKMVDN